MFTSRALNKYISDFISALDKNGFPVEKIILFGSYANGKAHERSDIDLAVWLKNDLQKHYTDIPELLRVVSSFHPIKPVFYNSGDTAQTDPFIEVIERTGKEVLCPHNHH